MNPEHVLERAGRANAERRHRRAIELCNVVLNRNPSPALAGRARLERAQALAALGEWAEAELDCRHASSHADSSAARALSARCLLELDRLDEAAFAIEAALRADDACAPTWELAARVFAKQGRRADALGAARRAHELDPGTRTSKGLVRALSAAGEHEEAIARIERALDRAPGDVELVTALGMSLYSIGRSEAAVTALRAALAHDPESIEAHCGLGWVLLRLGYFEEGFAHYEYRLHHAGDQRRFGVAPWRGEPLAGKSIIVCSEQGYGDTLQFARFVPAVRRLTEQTTLYVPPALARLLASVPGLGRIEARQPVFRSADYQALLMSLPHLLKTGEDVGAACLPCLFPEVERVARWRAELPPGPKIALAWQGNPKYGGEPWRSMPFAHFAPLVARFGDTVTFLSLQKHVGREQLHAASFGGRVIDLGDAIDAEGDAFVDSLAILSLVDAFITTDSALAHVAGSAGLRAYVLLSHAADWRWGTAPDRTPWYPSLRLFRQSVPGDWRRVIERVSAALAAASAPELLRRPTTRLVCE